MIASRAAAVFAAALVAVPGPADRGEARAEVTVRLGTGTSGGGFQAYGAAVAQAVEGADPELHVRVVATGGTAENVPMLVDGRLDLALVTGDVAHEVLHRAGMAARLRVLSVTYPSPGLLAVRADSPYRRIEDLRGRPVVLGVRGSGLVLLGRQVLDGLGLDPDRDVRPILVDRADEGPKKVLSGEAEALWGGGTAWPSFTALARAAPGARFLAPDPDGIRRITAKHPFLKPMTVPQGSYPGQARPIPSVGTWGVLLVRAGLPEETAYRLARALDGGHAALAARSAPGAATTAENTAAVVEAGDLHPGALRFLREVGALRR